MSGTAEAIVGRFREHREVDTKLTPAEPMRLTGMKDKSSFKKQVRQHPGSSLLERFPIRWNIAGVGEIAGAFCG
jgi:hypothetical protein